MDRFGLPASPHSPIETVAVTLELKELPDALDTALISNFWSSKNDEPTSLEEKTS